MCRAVFTIINVTDTPILHCMDLEDASQSRASGHMMLLCLEKPGSPETRWCFRSSNRKGAGKIHNCARSVLCPSKTLKHDDRTA